MGLDFVSSLVSFSIWYKNFVKDSVACNADELVDVQMWRQRDAFQG